MMIYFIPHKLMTIPPKVEYPKQIESLIFVMKSTFAWANDAGLKGKKVYSLLVKENEDPSSLNYGELVIWCTVECTKEEREEWEKLR